MKIKRLVIGLLTVLMLTGCGRPESTQAFSKSPLPTLELSVINYERSGPLMVAPTRVALGKEIEVKIQDLKPDAMDDLGLALLDSTGAKLQTITPVRPEQKFTIPVEGKPGSYKVWLAGSAFAANTGVNIVVLDVYDGVPAALRNPDPVKVVESYFQAIDQRNLVLAWQALTGVESSFGRSVWTRGLEPVVESVRLTKVTPQQAPLKATDQIYRCAVALEIRTRPWTASSWGTGRTTRHVTLLKESGGWRIDRIALLP